MRDQLGEEVVFLRRLGRGVRLVRGPVEDRFGRSRRIARHVGKSELGILGTYSLPQR